MPRPRSDWNPNRNDDTFRDWLMSESGAYEDVIEGIPEEFRDDVSAVDWEEADSQTYKDPRAGKTFQL